MGLSACYAVNVVIFVCSFGRVMATCLLVRDKYNEYPWMIKIIRQKTAVHGSLVKADLIVSTYKPFEKLESQLANFELTANRFSEGGKVQCTDARKPSEFWWPHKNTKKAEYFRDLMLWGVKDPFAVDPNSKSPPFLFRLEDIDEEKIIQRINKIENGSQCQVPVYDDASKTTKVKVHTVTYFTDKNACKEAFCRSPPGCSKNVSFTPELNSMVCTRDASPTLEESQQGAVMVCNGIPIGLLSLVGHKGNPDAKYSMFVTMAHSTDIIRNGIKIEGATTAQIPSTRKTQGTKKQPSRGPITSPSARRTQPKSVKTRITVR